MSKISTALRKKTATIIEKSKGKRKKVIKKYRFPMPDKAHARNALARIEQGKTETTRVEKVLVVRRACKMLYGAGTKDYKACCKKHNVRP